MSSLTVPIPPDLSPACRAGNTDLETVRHTRRDRDGVELSGSGGTLPSMAKPPGAWIVPPWVVPPEGHVAALGSAAYSLAVDAKSWHSAGQFGAVRWVARGMTAPVSRRWAVASWTMMRAECWVALCQAAFDDGAPTDREWERLGVAGSPIPYGGAHADDFAHGAWRTLAWLLGVVPDPPVALPDHQEDGTVAPDAQLYTLRPDPESEQSRASDQCRRARQRAEARRHWSHIRDRLAATEVPEGRDPARERDHSSA